MDIKYVKGDVTNPTGDGKKLIVHCCNSKGVMGAGVALAIAQKWPKVKFFYELWHAQQQPPVDAQCWYSTEGDLPLGSIQVVDVGEGISVVNLIGQTLGYHNGPPIRYLAIEEGLRRLRKAIKELEAKALPFSVHMPRMGAGLAGGDWDVIEDIILEELVDHDISVTVYDL